MSLSIRSLWTLRQIKKSREEISQDTAVFDQILDTLDEKDVVDNSKSSPSPVTGHLDGVTAAETTTGGSESDSSSDGEDDEGTKTSGEVCENTDERKVAAGKRSVIFSSPEPD